MIPVYQTMTVANDGHGNCFNACIASILELPLREVARIHPKFEGDYWGAWDRWFGDRGLFLNIRSSTNGAPKGFSIAAGRSSRLYPEDHEKAGQRIHHACVMFDGALVHDPFPIAGEFSDIAHYWTIDPITETQRAWLDERATERAA